MGKSIIVDFIKKHKWPYIIGIIFMFSASYIQTLFPKVLGRTIDILKEEGFKFSAVKINLIYILLIAAGTFITTYVWRNLIMGNSRSFECYLREMLYSHMQKLSIEFYNKKKTGDLIAYAINDISAVRIIFGPAAAKAISGITVCIISIYSMSKAVDWRLTIMSLLPIPFILIFMIKIGTAVQKKFRRVQENFASISDRVQENIYGIRVIKAYVQEEDEMQKFEKLNDDMMESNLSMVKVSSYLSPIIELCFSISFVLNLIIGGNMVLKGSISLGDFIAFNGYLTMIINPVTSIGKIITVFQRGIASLKRLNEIFDEKPEIKDGEKMINTPIKGEIQIRDLSFSYPNSTDEKLNRINIIIPKGHTLGIVGRTGSGKTTLVSLLLKLYNVDRDKIIIDGVDINDYTLDTLREGFGYVPQEDFLFSASIKDNIRFFKDIYSDEDVENAARVSCIYESIQGLPEGFNTMLGERGVNLSGGQKQRISIARAVIKDPAVLILDDSLSAVDTITEEKIINNLRNIRKDKTTIIIAHRLSAVEEADEIIVLDDGRIMERGDNGELLKKRGLYYEIYMEQFKDNKSKFQ